MSLIVVINGPVASAGSILYRFKVKGMKVPNIAAKIVTASKEILTVRHRGRLYPRANAQHKMIIEHINPLNKPTASSLIILTTIFSALIFLFAIPCTTIAAD